MFSTRPLGATLAAGLLAIDFLHIVQSRIAMLDVFLTLFVVSAFLFGVLDRDGRTQPVFRPWLMAAGVASGAAVATKWVGLCALFGAAALWWILPAARSSGERFSVALMSVVRREWLPMAFAFVAVPAIVYVGSYTTRIPGPVLALPWERGAWIRTFAGVQREMLHFHRHSSEIRYVG